VAGTENAQASDRLFAAGEVVYLRPVSNRYHRAIAEKMDRQKVLVLKKNSVYSKYEIYTVFGKLKESVHANNLEPLPPNTKIPKDLNITPEDAYELDDSKGMTMDRFISKLLQIQWQPIGVTLSCKLNVKEGQFDPVLKIKQMRVMHQIELVE
jgi:hypothetical protein